MIMNVNEYLKRIKYNGLTEPTIENLRKLCRAHVLAVPYSNAGLFGGCKIAQTLEEMYDTIVTRKEGATCVELNALFGWLLSELGFKIRNGQGRFYIDGEYTVPHHHLTPVAVFGEEEWFYDVGWKLCDPVKMEMMKPQVQNCGIFRIRETEESGWYYFERFRKTILNKDGKLIKQGPLKECWNGESTLQLDIMQSKDQTVWYPVCKFTTEHQEISSFSHMIDLWNYEPTSDLQKYIFNHKFTENGMYVLDTNEFIMKQFIDPVTEQIIEEKSVVTDIEATKLIKKYYGKEFDFTLNYYTLRQTT